VAAGVEDGVEVLLPYRLEANGLVELSFRGDILFEPDRKVSPEFRLVALGVERRTTALGDASVISAPASLKTK
jgi:hypothetical protein